MSVKATSGSECSKINENKLVCNIMDSCRVCFIKDTEMTNLFDKNDDIVDKILFCTGIQFKKDEGLPHTMCNNCLNDLSVAHRFKTSCLIANNSFRKLANIKTEVNGDNGVDNNECDDRMDAINVLELKEEFCIENDKDMKISGNDGDKECLESEKPTKQKKSGPSKKNVKLKQKLKKGRRARVKEKDSYNKRVPCRNLEPFKKVPCKKLQSYKEVPLKNELEGEVEEEAGVREKIKGEQCWVCEICGQKFRHRGSLSTHIRSHLPPAHACPQCSYRAAQKYDLIKHQRIHAGERPFQCDMCPATFYDASNMNSHIRRNHQKVLNFRCEVCGRGFYDRSKLNRHVDSHNNIKRHECGECHTAFTRLSYLKTHLRKRHGVEMPPLRPGPQRRNLIVEEPPVVYVKPKLIAVKQDTAPA